MLQKLKGKMQAQTKEWRAYLTDIYYHCKAKAYRKIIVE